MSDEFKEFCDSLPAKIEAISATIEEKMLLRIDGFRQAFLEGRYTSIAEYLDDHPYPQSH